MLIASPPRRSIKHTGSLTPISDLGRQSLYNAVSLKAVSKQVHQYRHILQSSRTHTRRNRASSLCLYTRQGTRLGKSTHPMYSCLSVIHKPDSHSVAAQRAESTKPCRAGAFAAALHGMRLGRTELPNPAEAPKTCAAHAMRERALGGKLGGRAGPRHEKGPASGKLNRPCCLTLLWGDHCINSPRIIHIHLASWPALTPRQAERLRSTRFSAPAPGHSYKHHPMRGALLAWGHTSTLGSAPWACHAIQSVRADRPAGAVRRHHHDLKASANSALASPDAWILF
jgi:hypothetical protein